MNSKISKSTKPPFKKWGKNAVFKGWTSNEQPTKLLNIS